MIDSPVPYLPTPQGYYILATRNTEVDCRCGTTPRWPACMQGAGASGDIEEPIRPSRRPGPGTDFGKRRAAACTARSVPSVLDIERMPAGPQRSTSTLSTRKSQVASGCSCGKASERSRYVSDAHWTVRPRVRRDSIVRDRTSGPPSGRGRTVPTTDVASRRRIGSSSSSP